MATIEHQTRTRAGECPTHGHVTAEKQVPKLKFPIVVTGIARLAAEIPAVPLPGLRSKSLVNSLAGRERQLSLVR